jgi:hypothetical protein
MDTEIVLIGNIPDLINQLNNIQNEIDFIHYEQKSTPINNKSKIIIVEPLFIEGTFLYVSDIWISYLYNINFLGNFLVASIFETKSSFQIDLLKDKLNIKNFLSTFFDNRKKIDILENYCISSKILKKYLIGITDHDRYSLLNHLNRISRLLNIAGTIYREGNLNFYNIKLEIIENNLIPLFKSLLIQWKSIYPLIKYLPFSFEYNKDFHKLTKINDRLENNNNLFEMFVSCVLEDEIKIIINDIITINRLNLSSFDYAT